MKAEGDRSAPAYLQGPFMYLVFFAPVLAILNPPLLRLFGYAAVAFVIVRGWPRAKHAPVTLALLAFSVAVREVSDWGGSALREITVPYTGWSGGMAYQGFLFFAVVALWSGLAVFRLAVVPLLLLEVAFGMYDWVARAPRLSDNPYLRTSEWRPLWTVALPLAWVLLVSVQEYFIRASLSQRPTDAVST